MHVVFLQQNHAALKAGLARPVMDFGGVSLPVLIARMGFAGEHNLYGAFAVAKNCAQAIGVAENKWRTFVCCKAARETNRERVWIERSKRAH